MTSFMKQRFKWYGCFCLVSGLPFLQLPGGIEDHNSKKLWKQLYLIYSLFCFSLLVAIHVLYFYQVIDAVLNDVHVFTKSLYILLLVVVIFKVVFNFGCAVTKSHALYHFFRSSAKYEITAGFVAPEHCDRGATRSVIRLLISLAFIANVSGSCYLSFEFLDCLGYTGMLNALLRAVCVGGNFVFYAFEMVHFIVLRPCAEVIRLYIEHQHKLLCTVLDAGSIVPITKSSRELEEIRIHLCAIVVLKQQLNAIWGWSIMASGAMVLIVSCVCIYSVFTEEFSEAQHLLTILYSVSSALDFVDIVIVSQQLVNEMRKIRQILQRAPIHPRNQAYYTQVST
ncbi:uncharacterized protein LOC142769263 [Rhipicephalus microplus]|uniref:uncharacterized protein LOC142769263 n=1 Tax=Rhipicephalus microplus TaxID=6941 RepID=UPI003F6ACBBD